jgi:phosphatidylglycerophosphate synthase
VLHPTYQPTTRRPIAGVFRKTAHLAVSLCLRWRIHADAVSYASIVAAALAGASFYLASHWPILLLVAPLFCLLRLWFNMLDGMVAMAAGQASRRGEILNDLPDRFSDVIIFAGLAESGLVHVSLGYWAAIAALLTAYVGTLSQAVGATRQYGGWMSKPWRMVVLMVGAVATFIVGSFSWHDLSLLDIGCIVIIAGCVQTIIARLRRTMMNLHDESRTEL